MSIYNVILAGGHGSRLWPVSSPSNPKQFWKFSDEDTMLQKTFKRNNIEENIETYLVTSEQHIDLINKQLLKIEAKNYNLIIEPSAKNTAPAIISAAQHIYNFDKNAIIVVAPSDHEVKDVEYYQTKIKEAIRLAQQGYYVMLGIKPYRPAVDFGYLKQGKKISKDTYFVEQFTEKPPYDRACEYFKSGKYYWNSGIFIFPVALLLEEIALFEPEMVEYTKVSLDQAKIIDSRIFLAAAPFLQIKGESIDCALMEKTRKAAFIKYDSFWSDVGTWYNMWEVQKKDDKGNVLSDNTLVYDTENSLIISQSGKKIITLGVKNVTVIEASDGLLVASSQDSHKVKDAIAGLSSTIGLDKDNEIQMRVVYKPWGKFENIIKEGKYAVKKIIVNPGHMLSLQYHHHRSEHWVIIKGKAEVLVGSTKSILKENDHIFIPQLEEHRLINVGNIDLELIEIQFGNLIEESDIVRLEDSYGRAPKVSSD